MVQLHYGPCACLLRQLLSLVRLLFYKQLYKTPRSHDILDACWSPNRCQTMLWSHSTRLHTHILSNDWQWMHLSCVTVISDHFLASFWRKTSKYLLTKAPYLQSIAWCDKSGLVHHIKHRSRINLHWVNLESHSSREIGLKSWHINSAAAKWTVAFKCQQPLFRAVCAKLFSVTGLSQLT